MVRLYHYSVLFFDTEMVIFWTIKFWQGFSIIKNQTFFSSFVIHKNFACNNWWDTAFDHGNKTKTSFWSTNENFALSIALSS